MDNNNTLEIYFEQQEGLLCGQHALNNLLQLPCFTPIDLADIAQELDMLEYQSMTGVNGEVTDDTRNYLKEGSGNVDESGNFSIQVLMTAVQRSHGLDLILWNSNEGSAICEDPTQENAFVLNRQAHWFTIRKINNRFWNLNSTLNKPEEITPFYMSAFLAQLREDGYSVFIVRGLIPEQASRAFGDGTGMWLKESQLLGLSEEKTQEEKDLEEAIALSLTAGKILGGAAVGSPLTEEEKKKEMREKRLAALEKRG